MKKILATLMMGAVLLTSQGAVAAEQFPIRVVVNGTQMYFPDGEPFIDGGNRILVPVRFVSEELDAKVDWQSKTQKITITDEEKVILLTVGEKQISINKEIKELDTMPVIKRSRTYVPIRFVSEGLGAQVKWDGKGRTVYIDNGKEGKPEVQVLKAGAFSVHAPEGAIVQNEEGQNTWFITTVSTFIVSGEKQVDPETNAVMAMFLNPSWEYEVKGSYMQQWQEAEEILLQQISSQTVASMKNHIKDVQPGDCELPFKTFYDGKYRIRIGSSGLSVLIDIYYK